MAHRGELVKYANGIVRDYARAEDVVQEAWMRFGAAASARSLDEPVGYLYRIVRNLAVDGRRKDQREQQVIQPDVAAIVADMADEAPSPEAAVSARDELRLLEEVLAELPPRTRIAIEMRRVGGCKFKEIAAHLGVSVTVAHDIVAEGLALCRQRVRPPS
jgi:RNA polymerase sigma-70 factor (ECF subfamily)